MGRKYKSALTTKLTPDNWKEELNLREQSLEDLTDLVGDFKAMEKFGKQLSGYLKEVIRAKMPDDEDFFAGPHFAIQFNPRVRAGALNEDLIKEEMGEEWCDEHRKPPIEYTEMRVNPVEQE